MSIVNDELLGGFDESRYPGEFLKRYEPLECLARDAQCETFYVKDKLSGGFAVAKCYTNTAQTSRFDKNSVLKNLSHEGIPRFLGEYATDAMLCTVREYVPGAALDAWACENHVSEGQALDVMIQLCDILTYLHTQSPPVIHRDIKPGNIIITDDGRVKLIDFGISRVYNENTTTDTVFFGTQEFAPPEQYGFSQTSARADIFSSGVLLGYLLTGKTDHKAVLSTLKNKALLHIYKKCTAFDPCARYATAAKLKRALLRAGGKRKKVLLCLSAIVIGCLVFLCAGFVIGRYTDFSPAFLQTGGVTFKEPLIEEAVRVQLGKTNGEPITGDDLNSVTNLYIFSSETAKTEDEINALVEEMVNNGAATLGPISTLDDLLKLPNLRQLFVSMQQVHDVAPIASLKSLESIVLKNNPITDISALSNLTNLERLSLFDTLVTDFSPLATCMSLQNLEVGDAVFESLEPFSGLKNLTAFSMYKVTVGSLDGIEKLLNLRDFGVDYISDGDVSKLLGIPGLKTVTLGEDMREAAQSALTGAKFSISYVTR